MQVPQEEVTQFPEEAPRPRRAQGLKKMVDDGVSRLSAAASRWGVGVEGQAVALGHRHRPRRGVELDWWRLAPSYRAELVHAGHPSAIGSHASTRT